MESIPEKPGNGSGPRKTYRDAVVQRIGAASPQLPCASSARHRVAPAARASPERSQRHTRSRLRA
jgi:hypothetical protein